MARLFYGIRNGIPVSIQEVKRGLACNCVCIHCKERLVARKGDIIIHHFAHVSNSSCKYSFEKSLYYLIRDILDENKCIVLPKLIAQFKDKQQKLQDAEQVHIDEITFIENETQFPLLQIRIGMNLIQIVVIYRNDKNLLTTLKEKQISSIYIDLQAIKTYDYTFRELKTYINKILQSFDSKLKKWIYHPSADCLEQKWKQEYIDIVSLSQTDNSFYSNISIKEKELYEQYGIEKLPDSCFVYPKNCPFSSKKIIYNNKIEETKMMCNNCHYFKGENYNKTFIICDNKHNDKLYRKLPEIQCTICKQLMTPTINNNVFSLTCKAHPKYNPKSIKCPNCGSSIIWNNELKQVECINSEHCSFNLKINFEAQG